MIAVAQALFSGVWLVDDAAQLYTIALAAKHPEMYRNDAKYRTGKLRAETEMMKPTMATPIGALICQPRSPRTSLE